MRRDIENQLFRIESLLDDEEEEYMDVPNIPIWKKVTITVDEAAIISNVGRKKIRSLIEDRDCDFVLYVGRKILIKREAFEDFLKRNRSI